MNGASAELPPNTISAAKIKSTKTSGINQNFFLSSKNLKISFIKSINLFQIAFAISVYQYDMLVWFLKIQNY